VTKTEYTVKGQVFRTSLPYFKTTESVTGRWRTMSYDPLGRVTQITYPDTLGGSNLTTKSCYAPFVMVTLDTTGARKREVRDAYGRVVKIEEYSTTASTCDTVVGTPYATTTYTYDLLGNLTKVVDHLGNRTTMRYDTLSRKLGMSDPDMSTNGTTNCGDLTALTPAGTYPWYAAPCWNYQYDAAGNLTSQRDAKSQSLWFRYDGLNRRSQKDYTTQKTQGSGDVVYVYDDTVTTFNRKGRLKQVTDASGNVTFEYDSRGRISKSTKVLDAVTYVTTSTYDGLGRLKEVTDPSTPAKTVEYLYTGPVLDKVQDKAGSGTTIYVAYSNYTSQSQPQTTTNGNGVVTTNTYADPAHATCVPANSFKLCTLKTQKGTSPLLQDLTYTFTADGNVDLITDPLNGNQDFGYDLQDRLTSATGPYGSGGATATLTYSYNQIGNLTNNSQLGAYTYPTSGASSVRPHAVTTAGANSYAYDNNGNLTGGAGRTLTWNIENKPLTVVQGSTTTTFVYDGDGGRVKKIVGSTTTRYISKLYECDNTNCSRFIWAGSTRIATIAASGTIHYWHGDHLGSSSVVTDSTGAKAQTLTYYPYGGTKTNQSFTTPAVNVPYKYTGKELDGTGLYYYEARYYDATLGRFISADTIVPQIYDPQTLNRYSYVRNNPLSYTDPTGHWGWNSFWEDLEDSVRVFFDHFLADTNKFLDRILGDGSSECGSCQRDDNPPQIEPPSNPNSAASACGGSGCNAARSAGATVSTAEPIHASASASQGSTTGSVLWAYQGSASKSSDQQLVDLLGAQQKMTTPTQSHQSQPGGYRAMAGSIMGSAHTPSMMSSVLLQGILTGTRSLQDGMSKQPAGAIAEPWKSIVHATHQANLSMALTTSVSERLQSLTMEWREIVRQTQDPTGKNGGVPVRSSQPSACRASLETDHSQCGAEPERP
jgi:RHS repeat-associated protein